MYWKPAKVLGIYLPKYRKELVPFRRLNQTALVDQRLCEFALVSDNFDLFQWIICNLNYTCSQFVFCFTYLSFLTCFSVLPIKRLHIRWESRWVVIMQYPARWTACEFCSGAIAGAYRWLKRVNTVNTDGCVGSLCFCPTFSVGIVALPSLLSKLSNFL